MGIPHSYKNFIKAIENRREYFKVMGASVGLGQRLKWPDDFFTISNSVNYQKYSLNDWGGFVVNNRHNVLHQYDPFH